MEHSVDLAAKTFVQAISPSSGRKILKKIKRALKKSNQDGSDPLDLDELDSRLAGFDFDASDDEEGENDNSNDVDDAEAFEDEVDAADSVGKALLLVKQVFFYFNSLHCK